MLVAMVLLWWTMVPGCGGHDPGVAVVDMALGVAVVTMVLLW